VYNFHTYVTDNSRYSANDSYLPIVNAVEVSPGVFEDFVPGFDFEHCIYYNPDLSNAECFPAYGVVDASNQNADPILSGILTSSLSPGIDEADPNPISGFSIGDDFFGTSRGGQPDIGAYEY
jgi:hypothetical protein